MAKKIAINGFGRIGRLTFRNLLKHDEVEVVAINDLTDNGTLAHLLKYDSAHGPFEGSIDYNDHELIVRGKRINAYAERDPVKLPWKELGVDLVEDVLAGEQRPHLADGLIADPDDDAAQVPGDDDGAGLPELVEGVGAELRGV